MKEAMKSEEEEFEGTSQVHDPKARRCLACQEPFASEWSGDRICRRCKARDSWRQGGDWLPGGT